MVAITLPDGRIQNYDGTVTGATIAGDIGPGLAKAALCIRVNGDLWDLSREIGEDATIAIVTSKDEDEALDVLRHDAAHIMAEAVKELYPGTQVTIGPNVENGFFYDFARDEPFTPEDLERIEARMHEIVDRGEAITREVWDRDEAISYFEGEGETYKAEIIRDLPESENISVYKQGAFLDLCRGPHLPSTTKLGHAFKLMSLAGAYWRGDSRNAMLQRIYGTAWRTEKELKAYLHRLEEAEKRDHRKLGRELSLFHLQEEAAGSVFWHPKGWLVYREVEAYMRRRLDASDYQEVKTPQLIDRKLWEESGHWEKFRDNMFTAADEGERVLALKPMNCPGHVQIFRQGLKSYRDLPLRLAEFGSCHRSEPSGALHGLMRVRQFTQDDAHIFCAEDQINAETIAFCELLQSVYRDFGFEDVNVLFADRPPVRAGTDAVWDRAEAALREAVDTTDLEWELNPGEGAFYGPKLEFHLTDAIGRSWQCGTLQVDFVLPDRLDASYVGEDGAKHRPVMLHRAILGSFERFMAILIEHHAGKLPLWLAPVQVVVATITEAADEAAQAVCDRLAEVGIRAELDLRNEKINYKVREHSLAKTPYIFVLGEREAAESTVSVRRLGDKKQEVLALDKAVDILREEATPPDAR
jgi:threonyl-tRNA synthetase